LADAEWRCGCAGQAVIQFAKDRRSGLLYALKFFLSNTAFGDEVKLYTDQGNPLGHFLPQLRNVVGAVGHGAPVVDAHGQPLPPCIVMEKGESLDVWMKRNRDGMDMVTGLQVCRILFAAGPWPTYGHANQRWVINMNCWLDTSEY